MDFYLEYSVKSPSGTVSGLGNHAQALAILQEARRQIAAGHPGAAVIYSANEGQTRDLARVYAGHVAALDARTHANDAFQSVSLAFLAFYQRQRQRPTCPACDNVGPCDPCGAVIEAGNDATSLAQVALEAAFAAEAAAGRFAALLKGAEVSQ